MTKYADPFLPRENEMSPHIYEWSLVLRAILDRGLSFSDNADVSIVSVSSHATPGTEFSVSHGLGKIPTGYIVTKQAGAGSVYDGTTSNTETTLYLKSDVASTSFTLMVF